MVRKQLGRRKEVKKENFRRQRRVSTESKATQESGKVKREIYISQVPSNLGRKGFRGALEAELSSGMKSEWLIRKKKPKSITYFATNIYSL